MESGPLVSVILWSAKGKRRNAGRAVELLQMAVETEGGGRLGEPGSSRALPGSNLFLKKFMLELGVQRELQAKSARAMSGDCQTKPNQMK